MDKERKDKMVPKGVKPNYQMWIILLLVAVILGVSYFSRISEIPEIQVSKFTDMVERKDIKKIVLIKNEEQIEITLKAEALQNSVYKNELEKRPLGLTDAGPHYRMKIGSIDKFYEQYDQITKNIPRDQKIDIQVDNRSDYTGLFWNVAFLFLLVFGFWILMRRMTGGGRTRWPDL
ncbi:MAG: ATP-dependent metallopeptidase FtsH/Yme1/Tma family protein [Cyclobacteriaceae bacterium]